VIGSSSQDLSGDDKIRLETSVSEAGFCKHCAGVMYNWKINITTRSRNWERNMNLVDLILEIFGK